MPGSIRALITHRVDRLPLPKQLTLRTATVIGRTFPQRTLCDVYQDDRHRDQVDDHLDDFTRLHPPVVAQVVGDFAFQQEAVGKQLVARQLA